MAKPAAQWGSLPFAEQIAFFRDKVNLPTERWQDLLGSAHDRAFVVAGAMKADLLADLHAAVLKAIDQGTTLETFRKDFQAIVAKRGWTGWTGEDTPEGVAWRTKTIYGTNLRTSYQAGRHAQAQAIAHRRPFWRYVHNATVLDPRPEHVAWHGIILRAGDPWFSKRWPPSGWGCRCRIETLSQRDMDRLGKSGPDTPPDDGTYEWLDKRTGQTHTIPKGIDPGWDYTPGDTRDLIAEVKAKAAGLPPQLGEALAAEVAKLADKAPTIAQSLSHPFMATQPKITEEVLAQKLSEIGGERLELLRQFIEKRQLKSLFVTKLESTKGTVAWKSKNSAIEEFLRPGPGTTSYTTASKLKGFTHESARHVTIRAEKSLDLSKANADTVKLSVLSVIEKYKRALLLHPDIGNVFEKAAAKKARDKLKGFAFSHENLNDEESSIIGTWLHEIGHQVHYASGGYDKPRLLASLTRYGDSNYGDIMGAEWHAEHWAAWFIDRDALAEFDIRIATYFDNLMKTAINNGR